MKKIRLAALAGVGMLGAAVFAGAGTAGPGFMNKYPSESPTQDCGDPADNNTITYNGPLKMWPPNHKLQNVSMTATDGSGDATTLTVTVTPTDAEGGDGGPNHDPDYTPGDLTDSGTPSSTVDFWLRSERSGKGDGRTYTINWVASFDNGNTECSSEQAPNEPFVVLVPHDMRGGAGWK